MARSADRRRLRRRHLLALARGPAAGRGARRLPAGPRAVQLAADRARAARPGAAQDPARDGGGRAGPCRPQREPGGARGRAQGRSRPRALGRGRRSGPHPSRHPGLGQRAAARATAAPSPRGPPSLARGPSASRSARPPSSARPCEPSGSGAAWRRSSRSGRWPGRAPSTTTPSPPTSGTACGRARCRRSSGCARRHGGRTIYDSRDVYMPSREFARLGWPLRPVAGRDGAALGAVGRRVLTVNDAYADLLATQLRVPRPPVVMNCPEIWTPPDAAARPDPRGDGHPGRRRRSSCTRAS